MTKPFKGLQMRVLNPTAVVSGLPVTADFSTVCDPYAVCRKKSAAMRYQYSTQQDPDQMRKTRIDFLKKKSVVTAVRGHRNPVHSINGFGRRVRSGGSVAGSGVV